MRIPIERDDLFPSAVFFDEDKQREYTVERVQEKYVFARPKDYPNLVARFSLETFRQSPARFTSELPLFEGEYRDLTGRVRFPDYQDPRFYENSDC